jgi:ankyrin repeat protein
MTGHQNVLELLLQHHQGSSSVSLEPHLSRCVGAAASMGHAGIIRLIGSLFDLKQLNLQPWKPLHDAAAAGHGSVVQLLLQQRGIAVDQVSAGVTALHLAAHGGHLQVAQLLLEAGADLTAKTIRNSCTALYLAAQGGHPQMVQLLLQAGAQVEVRTNKEHATPLHIAANVGCSDVVQLLLHAGAAVEVRAASNWTPLHLAAQGGRVEVMLLLLQAGADVHATTSSIGQYMGSTALHIAAAYGGVEVTQLLLHRGASINRETDTGDTALTLALGHRQTAVVQLLLNQGAAVSADTLLLAARHAATPEGVLLVMGALDPAADASVLSNACRSAAAASRMENVVVLLKQLCLVDRAAMRLVVRDLPQPRDAAAACVDRLVAETKNVTEQQQRLGQQQREVTAQRLAAQQLLLAIAGTQQQIAAERQAAQQLLVATAGMQRQAATERQAAQHLLVATAGMQQQVATEGQALRKRADVEASVPEQRGRGWALARECLWRSVLTTAVVLLVVWLSLLSW